MPSVSDTCRTNMLAALVQSEPQVKSNIDLMREVIAAGGLAIITPTDETAAVQYWRYFRAVRG